MGVVIDTSALVAIPYFQISSEELRRELGASESALSAGGFLVNQSFFISAELYQELLESAGEVARTS